MNRLTRIIAGVGAGTLICALSTISASAAPTSAVAPLIATTAATTTTTTAAPLIGTSADGVIAGQYIVVLKDATGLRAAGIAAASSSTMVAGAVARGRKLGAQVQDQYSSALQGYSAQLSQSALNKVRADPAVAYVQANQKYTAATTSGTQGNPHWGLDRIDQRSLPLNKSYYYTDTGAGVTAYVVDTGILSTHHEFTRDVNGNTITSRVSGGVCDIPINKAGDLGCDSHGTASCGSTTSTPDSGHGTHVAGTIGGINVGVAKQVSLVPVRVLACDGTGSSASVAAGLDWIVKNHTSGPAVANMSLASTAKDTVVDAAVKRVIADNVSVVVAAGNGDANGKGLSACSISPSDVKTAITVGATTRSDARATFSNYGSCVDLYAPGVGVISAWDTSTTATAEASGTSMATPHVSGAVALYLEKHPTATPAAVQTAVVGAATADKVTNVSSTWPRKELFALQAATKPKATTTAGEITSGTALLSGQKICSPNTLYCLSERASDGVLVLQKPDSRTIWSAGKGAAWTKMNTTGNLASYDKYNRPVWSSKTSGVGASTLFVQNTGNLLLSNNSTGAQEWTSKTTQKTAPKQAANLSSTLTGGLALYRAGVKMVSPNGTFSLALRVNGDLVLAKKTVTIWHTKAKDDDWLTVRTDGDMILYRADGTVEWSTKTSNTGAATLILKNSGNLALTRISDSKILWSSKTSGA